ncbi:MAG TPA: CAP domain-containing protein, partial [Anaerolineales bacterium]|nr:CAP domain-containing protein [Anaerolineales bacterium]
PNLPRGTKVEYRVLPGDTLAGIAVRFNSSTDAILEANTDVITDANALQVGDVLQIPVNLVTATATLPSTSTPVTPTAAAGQATSAPVGTPAASNATQNSSAQCAYQENSTYVTDLTTLINNQRTSSGLTSLSTNSQLATVALEHAKDMACNYYFSHRSETNGSTPEQRVANAGVQASLVVETIYAAKDATPQQALDWWLDHVDDSDSLLNPTTTQIGVAYVKADESLFGGYFVVVMAK